MTEDVSSGRLYAEVVSDTTGFSRDLQRKLNAEVRGIRAKIKAEIDTRGLVGQARAAAKQASQAATVRFKAEIDTRGLVGQARAAAVAASKAATVRLRAELDTREVAARAKAAAAAASSTGVDVNVGADTSKADSEVEAFRARTRGRGVDIPVSISTSTLNQAAVALTQLSKAPAIAGGIYLLGTAVIQLGGGLIALSSAAAQAVGVLGAIPNLVGIAGQGIAALIIGVSGVGDALKAMGKAEEAATTTSAAGAAQARATAQAVEAASRARERAARSVADAQRSLADAQREADQQAQHGARAVADARRALADARMAAVERERAAIERVRDAEWSLARAQESAQNAQANLTRAREQARERIEDLNMALRHSALDEEAAMLAVEQARQNLQDAEWNPMTSDLQKQQADLAYRQALAQLEGVKESNDDLKQETAKANKAGVEGSDEVKDARDQVRDTLHAEQEAAENLTEAQRAAAREQRDSARAIADAQRALGDTIQANAEAAVDAARRIADAHRGIADAQQNLADAQERLAEAQEVSAQGGTAAAAAAAAAADALNRLSPAGRRFAQFLFGLKPRWLELRNAVAEALLPPLQRGIQAALPLLDTLQRGLVGTATVVGGLAETLGQIFGEETFRSDIGTIMASNNRALASFGQAGLNMVQILRHIGVAVGPLVEKFAAWTAKLTGGWLETIKAKRATGELTDFFNRAGEVAAQLGRILGNIALALFNIGKAATPTGQELLDTFERVTARWREWTQSDTGQQRMQEFFQATKPVTEELGRLVSKLAEFIIKISEGGGGPMVAFVKTLNTILDALNKIMSIPGAAPVLGVLLTVAGIGGALGLVAAVILRIAKNIGKLGKLTGLSKLISGLRGSKAAIEDELPADKKKKDALGALDGSAKKSGDTLRGKFTTAVQGATAAVGKAARAVGGWVVGLGRAAASTALFTARLVANRIAIIAGAVASGIARAATVAWTAVTWALGVAMKFALGPIGLIIIGIGLLVAAVIWAWRNQEWFRTAVLKVWAAIQAAVSWAWNKILKPTLDDFATAIRIVGAISKWLWEHAVKPAWSAIQKAISLYWNYWLKPTFAAFKWALSILGAAFKWLWERGIRPNWNSIWGAIKWGWEHAISPAFDAIKRGVGLVRDAFTLAKDAIGRIWDKIKDVVKKPIKGVIEIINDWVIGKFNWVSEKFGGPKVDPIDLTGFRDGGDVPGKRRGARADNMIIRATPDEFMVRRWAADKLRRVFPGALEYINKFGRLPGYAGGGFVRPVNAPWSGVWGRYASGGHHPALDFPVPIGTRVAAVMDGVVNAVKHLAGSYGKHIRISHAGNIESIYAHLSNTLANVGQRVAAGQLIGQSGNTGNSTGPHLHLELRRSGSPFNFTDMLLSGKAPPGGNALQNLLGKVGGKLGGLIGEPLEWLKGQIDAPVRKLLERFGNSPFAQMLAGMPRKLIESAANRIKGLFGADNDTGHVGEPGEAIGSSENRRIVREMAAARGWTGAHWSALDWLVMRESSYNHLAQNPTSSAFGLFQFLSSTWGPYGPKTSDPRLQTRYGLEYIARRYGNPLNARAFHLAHGWYDRGGWLQPGTHLVRNDTGEAEAVLTGRQWGAVESILSRLAGMTPNVRNAAADGAAPLVGSLAVSVGDPRDLSDALDEVQFRLRAIRRGGVYARRTA